MLAASFCFVSQSQRCVNSSRIMPSMDTESNTADVVSANKDDYKVPTTTLEVAVCSDLFSGLDKLDEYFQKYELDDTPWGGGEPDYAMAYGCNFHLWIESILDDEPELVEEAKQLEILLARLQSLPNVLINLGNW